MFEKRYSSILRTLNNVDPVNAKLGLSLEIRKMKGKYFKRSFNSSPNLSCELLGRDKTASIAVVPTDVGGVKYPGGDANGGYFSSEGHLRCLWKGT